MAGEGACERGVSVDEYLNEVITQGMGPEELAVEYVKSAEELLKEAVEELKRGSVRRAAEKVWGAAALAIKAHAYWREGRRLASHADLWAHKRVVAGELGKWVHSSWAAATEMHVCFYEGWCDRVEVGNGLEQVGRLVKEIAGRVLQSAR